MKHFLLICAAAIILIIVSCRSARQEQSGKTESQQTDCVSACAKIPFAENAPIFAEKDKEAGSYYGSLAQKKKGTPDTWVHVLEGSKSAAWVSPENALAAKCDCK